MESASYRFYLLLDLVDFQTSKAVAQLAQNLASGYRLNWSDKAELIRVSTMSARTSRPSTHAERLSVLSVCARRAAGGVIVGRCYSKHPWRIAGSPALRNLHSEGTRHCGSLLALLSGFGLSITVEKLDGPLF